MLSHATVALLLGTGYTPADARALKDAIRRDGGTTPGTHSWALARVPVTVAVAAITAGLSPDEAATLTEADLPTLATMAALRGDGTRPGHAPH